MKTHVKTHPRAPVPLVVLFTALALWAVCGCADDAADVAATLKKQDAAKHSLQGLGASFSSKKLPVIGSATVVDLSGVKPLTDEAFRLLKQLGVMAIMEVNLSGTSVTDAQLAQLNDPDVGPWIASLNLSGTDVSDGGLIEVSKLPRLGQLNVMKTKVTPAGIKAFLKAREDNPGVQAKKTTVKADGNK